MKVLIVFNHPAPYKIKVFNELAKLMDLDVLFERTRASDRPDAFYGENKINFNASFMTKGYFGYENSYSNEIVEYLKQNHQKYDLIIMNGYSKIAELKAIHYLNKNKIPFTLLINGGLIKREGPLKKAFKKSVIRKARYYLSPCEEADEYLLYYSARKEDIFHYPYSSYTDKDILSKPLNTNEKTLKRKELGLPEGKLFISAAQFIKRKNNIQLIRLFKETEYNLLLVGSGKERKKYQKLIAKENISNVKLMPFLNKKELFDLMPLCDGFITLSKEDIFGHTTLEAMACGIPVISSSNVVSSRHYIKNDYNGYCFDLNNIVVFKDALNKINNDMANNAIETARTTSIEKTAKAMFEIFKEITKCK